MHDVPDELQYCTFHLGNLLLGIPVLRVQEVIRYHEMTDVPLAPSVIRGLINLRGEIVTAIDLRRRLGLPDREGEELPMNVVVRDQEGAVSLLVDEIGDVIEVDPEKHELPPETIGASVRDLVTGVYKLPDKLLLVLDTEEAISTGALA